MLSGEEEDKDDDAHKMSVAAGKAISSNLEKVAQKNAAEEKRLAVLMIPKRKKRLYDRIMHGKKRRNREVCNSSLFKMKMTCFFDQILLP